MSYYSRQIQKCLTVIDRIGLNGNFYLDLGSGFKSNDTHIEYYPRIAQNILQKHSLLKKIKLVIEPGRILVENAGYLVSNVKAIKRRGMALYITLD